MTRVRTGIERLVSETPERLADKRVGLVVHAASVDSRFRHTVALVSELPGVHVEAIFGPQHGVTTHTQDNMIEWEPEGAEGRGPRVHSLYGRVRKPTPEMLAGLDVLVFDLQDVGSRYYTYIQTMALCMEACGEQGVEFMVLDRPNPLGGLATEGPILEPEYRSFVGLHPLCVRHGMTVAELALMYREQFGVACELELVLMDGWRRELLFPQTGLPWVLPSPNMPWFDTALVYPGMCLLEGTNLSEGRGTTRPFEFFGAPFIDPVLLTGELERLGLPGVHFRPARFQPTFQKWQGRVCGGAQIHVLDPRAFRPFFTAVAVLWTIRRLYPDQLEWRPPPYEYEQVRLPIDILAGTPRVREAIDEGTPLEAIDRWLREQAAEFDRRRTEFLCY